MESTPSVRLQSLDKISARTATFEAQVGQTVKFGSLYIKVQSCQKAPPVETPESAAFLQIWQGDGEKQKSEWVFSGWMFASSPALSAMDHPLYDVWVIECTGGAAEEDIPPNPAPENQDIRPDEGVMPENQTPAAPVEDGDLMLR